MDPLTRKEQDRAARAIQILDGIYPNLAWMVNVDLRNGVMKIVELNTMDMSIPYVILTDDIMYSEKVFPKVLMRAGGEILERAGLPRAWMSKSVADERILSAPRDYRGEVVLDYSDIKDRVS